MTTRKLDENQLRRMALAFQNAAEWQGRFFAELINELDGKSVHEVTEEVKSAGKAKGKKAPVEDMEEVESPFNPMEDADEVVDAPKKGKGKKAAAPVETEDADDFMNDDATEEDQGPTIDDVRKTVKDFATKHGKEKALKLLGKFKVTAIPDIKKADYAKVIELAKKYL